MATCGDMKEGQLYECPSCGLQLKVMRTCEECGEHSCEISCCDHALKLVE